MKKTTYSSAMAELKSILDGMNDSSPDIDTMEKQVERARELIQVCRETLTKTDRAVQAVFEEMKQNDN